MTIYLMNTTMMPNAEGTYKSSLITKEDAANMIDDCAEVISAIGHDSSAAAMSAVLGREIKMNRLTIQLKDGDQMICLKLNSRPPEGAVLSLEQMDEIGYQLVAVSYHC